MQKASRYFPEDPSPVSEHDLLLLSQTRPAQECQGCWRKFGTWTWSGAATIEQHESFGHLIHPSEELWPHLTILDTRRTNTSLTSRQSSASAEQSIAPTCKGKGNKDRDPDGDGQLLKSREREREMDVCVCVFGHISISTINR